VVSVLETFLCAYFSLLVPVFFLCCIEMRLELHVTCTPILCFFPIPMFWEFCIQSLGCIMLTKAPIFKTKVFHKTMVFFFLKQQKYFASKQGLKYAIVG